MISKREYDTVAASHRLEKPGSVQEPAVTDGDAGLVGVDQFVIQEDLVHCLAFSVRRLADRMEHPVKHTPDFLE